LDPRSSKEAPFYWVNSEILTTLGKVLKSSYENDAYRPSSGGGFMNVKWISYTHPEAAHQFVQSLKESGFAVIKDHHIPEKLIFEVYDEWKTFFNSEDKHKYLYDKEHQAGYFPFQSENAKDHEVKDLKEFFHVYSPADIPKSMSDQTREVFEKLNGLAKELLSWLQKETPKETRSLFSMPLQEMIEGSRETLLRPIYYPPLKGDEEPKAIRAAAHEDINLITVLPASTAPGLEVRDLKGNWIPVECDPGQIVVNAGDMLQMASRGFYRSTTHRVVNPKDPELARAPRLSLPLFLHPRGEVQLSEKHTARSYLNERLSEIGLK
jgi:isopenicillin N synthase-like dioxygenase